MEKKILKLLKQGGLLTLFIFLAFSQPTKAQVTSIVCDDSDDGISIFEKGITTGWDSYGSNINTINTYTDTCSGDRVLEFHCYYQNDPHNGDGYVSMSNEPCEAGCEDGACIPCEYSPGDANQDGYINFADMSTIRYFIDHDSVGQNCSIDCDKDGVITTNDMFCVKDITIGECTFEAGDANQDGAINEGDITELRRSIGDPTRYNCSMDCTKDGEINSLDIRCVNSKFDCPFALGDANQDGTINVLDISATQYFLSHDGATENCSMDCNKNGTIDSADIYCLAGKMKCASKPGDANHDGVLDVRDFLAIKDCMNNNCDDICGADCNKDGYVTNSDYFCLRSEINDECRFKNGDADQDGDIDVFDILHTKSHIDGTIAETCSMDCNEDGYITNTDYFCIRSKLVKTCEFQIGDANQDGTIDNLDMGTINAYYYDKEGEENCSMDCNEDGDITPADIVCVRNKIMGSCTNDPGDANGDDTINILDMGTIKKCLDNDCSELCGIDCNQDGRVTNTDYFCVRNKILGISTGVYPTTKITQIPSNPDFQVKSYINTNAYDINNDGIINIIDSTWMEEHYSQFKQLYRNRKEITHGSNDFQVLDKNGDNLLDSKDKKVISLFRRYMRKVYGNNAINEAAIKAKIANEDMDLNNDQAINRLDYKILSNFYKTLRKYLRGKDVSVINQINYDLNGDGILSKADIDYYKVLKKKMKSEYGFYYEPEIVKAKIMENNPDLNGDSIANETDRGIIKDFYKKQKKMKKYSPGDSEWNAGYDLNNDGVVDDSDILKTRQGYIRIKTHSRYGKILLSE